MVFPKNNRIKWRLFNPFSTESFPKPLPSRYFKNDDSIGRNLGSNIMWNIFSDTACIWFILATFLAVWPSHNKFGKHVHAYQIWAFICEECFLFLLIAVKLFQRRHFQEWFSWELTVSWVNFCLVTINFKSYSRNNKLTIIN